MITLTREEAQQVLDALESVWIMDRTKKQRRTIETLHAKLREPEPEREQCDMPCIEDDGCPTEKAVLQRFWRKHRQPEPKPVAWLNKTKHGTWSADALKCEGDEPSEPLYTAPPQREWQGLTDEEITATWNDHPRIENWVNAFARDIEAKLKEKNT